ncbi:MAG: transposase [Gemmataceae bacterium]
MSKRAIEEVSASVLEAPVSPGTISNLNRKPAAALAVPHQEVREAIAAAAVKHADETGWKLKGKKRWLWVAATRTLALFVIHAKRSLDALVWMSAPSSSACYAATDGWSTTNGPQSVAKCAGRI